MAKKQNKSIDPQSIIQKAQLSSPKQAESILQAISNGTPVELDVDKQTLLNNFNTFLLAEAYTQLPTIIKLQELQLKCLDRYYEQVNELLDEDDANVFLLDKIIKTINDTIDRSNNMILRLGLNSDITSQLMIQHVDNSQNLSLNVYQSQLSKQRVLDFINLLKDDNVQEILDANQEQENIE